MRYSWSYWTPGVSMLVQHKDDLANKLREIADNDPEPSFNDAAINAIAERSSRWRWRWASTCTPTAAELRSAADAIDATTIRRVAQKLTS